MQGWAEERAESVRWATQRHTSAVSAVDWPCASGPFWMTVQLVNTFSLWMACIVIHVRSAPLEQARGA